MRRRADEFWLEHMLRHFEDPQTAGVCGQQIVPHDADKNPHEWFRPQSSPSSKLIHFSNTTDFDALTPQEKRNACGWDDVNAMYRKSVLKKIPFENVVFGEDMLWAKAALQNGHKLVYDSSARVNHYHFQFPNYTYKRVLIANVFIYKCFGLVRDKMFTFKDYALVIYRNFKWGLHPKWILHNFDMLTNHNKATKTLLKNLRNDTMSELEKSLALDVPLGQQKAKNNSK